MRTTLIGVLALAFSEELAAQRQAPPEAWSATLGAAAVLLPKYPGSDEYRVLPFPMTEVTFRDRVFLGPSTAGPGFAIGAYAVRTPRLSIVAEVGGLDNRPASRAAALAGMEDRDLVAAAGASLSYRMGLVQASIGVTQGINDDAGLLGTARLTVSRPVGRRFIASAGLGATFADARQMRRDFGVTETETSRRRALILAGDDRLDLDEGDAYRPSGGLRQVGGSVSLVYIVSQRWAVVGFGGLDRLSDEAVESPLVRRREQVSGGIGVRWRL